MIAESQEFNDNVGNEKTELCFQCRTYRTKDDFNTAEGGNICKDCFNEYQTLCKNLKVSFKEVEGRLAKTLRGTIYKLTDVYCVIGTKQVSIRGYNQNPCDSYNSVNHEKAEIFGLKMQFLKSQLKHFWFYGSEETLEEYPFVFSMSLMKNGLYDIGGNCEKISNAYSFRSLDINKIFAIIEYHTKLTSKQKELIKQKLKEGFVFSNEDENGSHKPSELNFKDYSNYEQTRKPQITLLTEV